MRTQKLLTILFLTFIELFSCKNDEPIIDYNKLIIGKWNETKATDSYIDYKNASNNLQTIVTDESYSLEFMEDYKFTLFHASNILDSGSYYLTESDNEIFLRTFSVDNIRIPNIIFTFPIEITDYQIMELTETKLVLTSIILIAQDAWTGEQLNKREFIWELSRQ